jgi:hypothetical protein
VGTHEMKRTIRVGLEGYENSKWWTNIVFVCIQLLRQSTDCQPVHLSIADPTVVVQERCNFT